MGSGGKKGRREGGGGEKRLTFLLSLLSAPRLIFFSLLKFSLRCPHYLTAWNRLLKMSLKAPGD